MHYKKSPPPFGREPMRARKQKKNGFSARYIGITAVFLLVCIFYAIKILDIQSDGKAGSFDANGLVTRTYTVAGVRGEIYDRNGVLLVGNEISYDIIFEYGSIPDTTAEFNREILATLDAMKKTDSESFLANDFYVLEGTYPNLRFCTEVSNNSSEEYKYLLRFLDANNISVEHVTAEDVATVLRRKYKIYEDNYTNEEITALLRVRYEMERVQFGYYNPYVLAEKVPTSLVSSIQESGIDGVNFKINSERVYMYPGYASHILGRVGKIQEKDLEYYTSLGYSMDALVGNSGCEAAFENDLHSQDGILKVVYDENGSIVKKSYEVAPISGNDVWLTIDIEMQIAAEDSLAQSVGRLPSANAGAAVALEANSGAVLAMASYPTFDLTKLSSIEYYNTILGDENLPELNRALSGVYPPGSVYKIGAALAALEEGQITSSSTYTCNHVFPYMHKPTCLGNHGATSVIDAIRDSCNVFFYYLGMDMGTDKLTKYTKPMGLGVPTGIELPEKTGTVAGRATSDLWNVGNDLSAAIGQANHGYTPLQMGVYTAALANGGNRYQVHLLHSVHEFFTGKVIFNYEKSIIDTVEFSKANRNTVLEGMRKVVTSHTLINNNFASLPVLVGGKTGTAEVTGKADYALFTGVAPYDDPEIVGLCIIEQGVTGENASYTVSEMFKAYYNKKAAQDEQTNN